MARSKLATQFNHPMLYLFTPRVPFIPISRSLARRTLRLCEGSIELLSALFLGEFSRLRRVVGHLGFLRKQPPVATSPASPTKTALLCPAKAAGDEEERAVPSLLDLPDLALDCVLERLSPAGLRSVSGVCSSLRDHCTSDHLWESHLRRRWGGVIGHAARSEWRCESASKAIEAAEKRKGSLFESFLSSVMPSEKKKKEKESRRLPPDSVMAFYLSLESGEFWFPAQVYNRENGHVGFMLSCYDAHLCYDSKTDTFEARYHPYGRRTTEENIEWDRLRAAPVNTHPFTLHVSDCLRDLRPGDHVEIQWRRNKEFPYGWWYGLVAHLETCDGNESLCRCHYSDTVVLEFKQYCPGSRWRRTMVNRKDHREEGNEVDGFYGGIRKLYDANEVSRWSRFWPTQSLEQ